MNAKYQYRTRQAAEAAANEIGGQRDRLQFALNAVLNGTVRWIDGKFGDQESYYQFGIVPRRSSLIWIQTHYCPATGQAPSTVSNSEETLQEHINALAALPPEDAEGRSFREGLHAVRRMMEEIYKGN